MLRWVFPTGRTDPISHLAYWHIRLLTELLSPDRRQRTLNILQATKNMVRLLAENHDLLSPLTHHFMCLAGLGLLELRRFGETRREARGLVEDVLGYSLARSAWSAGVRERLGEMALPRQGEREDGEEDGEEGEEAVEGRNLRRLAELATAVDGVGAGGRGVAGEDGLKDGGLGVGDNTAHAESGGALQQQEEQESDGEDTPPEQVLVDVREVLRNGYLAFY